MDDQFEALADTHRRRLLVSLLEHNPQEKLPIPEGVYLGEKDVADLKVEMLHIHLPKLAEAGFIRWEPGTRSVVKGPAFDEIRPLLELLDTYADLLSGDWRMAAGQRNKDA